MGLACLFGHKWNGCKCERCGEIRDEGHDWDLCKGKCRICGKECPVEHDWDGCKCKRCGAWRDEAHLWNGCQCTRCGMKRDEGHDWDLCKGKCRICGKVRPAEHDWDGCKCKRCGAEKHNFISIPGRCAELCTACGEERDYMKIASDETEPNGKRLKAIKKLKNASMIPEAKKRNCTKGKHIWKTVKKSMLQGGGSATEFICAVCGKKYTEIVPKLCVEKGHKYGEKCKCVVCGKRDHIYDANDVCVKCGSKIIPWQEELSEVRGYPPKKWVYGYQETTKIIFPDGTVEIDSDESRRGDRVIDYELERTLFCGFDDP